MLMLNKVTSPATTVEPKQQPQEKVVSFNPAIEIASFDPDKSIKA